MNSKTTINDVARLAGVSKSTVSQYLNGRFNYMSEATRERIAKVIEDLDYRPNGLARSLKQNRTFLVGIIVADLSYSLSITCIQAIENELQDRGIQVIICNADENPDKEADYIETLLARQVDGLILFPTGDVSAPYQQLLEAGVPFVLMDRLLEQVTARSILLDNEMAVKIGIEELVRAGHHAIGMITLPLTAQPITPRKERVSGYRRAMLEAGLPLREEYLISVPAEEVADSLEQLLALPEPPTALLAGNDIVLGEVLKAANRLKLTIPEQLSIIGIDAADFAEVYNPAITTIKQPAYEMGSQAARILLASIEDRETGLPITYRFPPALQRGESVLKRGCPKSDHKMN
ncbi:LacI family DNA-binding transcriptional regulator [Paenibacillus apis]|uniref:LacI family DNA-binding transcriptional regulator n=1 Tax=Paenibacillus apis TaxID=1792174 RepID=UPI002659F4DF|nr:LacI family DNA-binding transcriptional regulator [Paenibacillus apis]